MSATGSWCLLQVANVCQLANVALDTVEKNWTLFKIGIDQILAAFWLKARRTLPLEADKGGEPVDSSHAGSVDLTHCNLISGMSWMDQTTEEINSGSNQKICVWQRFTLNDDFKTTQ